MARPKKKSAPKQASGGARMKAAGKTPVQLGITAEQRELLKAAADDDSRPLTQYILHHAMLAALAAKKIREKS